MKRGGVPCHQKLATAAITDMTGWKVISKWRREDIFPYMQALIEHLFVTIEEVSHEMEVAQSRAWRKSRRPPRTAKVRKEKDSF